MFDTGDSMTDSLDIKQLSVFLPNRVGALLGVNRALETLGLTIRAISILEAADHSVVRLIVDRPSLASELLKDQGYSVLETELLAVALPEQDGVRRVLSALLMAELNVHYVYSLLARGTGEPILALHVEDPAAAIRVLLEHKMVLIGQDHLE
ncbi:MAG: hypothetical protein ACI9EF_003273 [Pseudohongiellaceae bacterium]|jgi:hypothetical protein